MPGGRKSTFKINIEDFFGKPLDEVLKDEKLKKSVNASLRKQKQQEEGKDKQKKIDLTKTEQIFINELFKWVDEETKKFIRYERLDDERTLNIRYKGIPIARILCQIYGKRIEIYFKNSTKPLSKLINDSQEVYELVPKCIEYLNWLKQ